jgi:hypothetical protein
VKNFLGCQTLCEISFLLIAKELRDKFFRFNPLGGGSSLQKPLCVLKGIKILSFKAKFFELWWILMEKSFKLSLREMNFLRLTKTKIENVKFSWGEKKSARIL